LALPEARPVNAEDPLRLLVLGSVEARKGIDELLTAMERLRRVRGACAVVEVVGPLGTSSAQAQRWRRRGSTIGVQFTGPIPSTDVPARIAHSDGILMPSRREGLPFSLLEAMAASRPVLAARTGAIGELLADGAGTLIDPGEPGQLAAALLRWVDDPEHRLDLAAAGWHRVRCRYTAEHSLQTTWQAWTAALGREPGTTAPRRGP
jgi:glycosyltransferase involved in cell wall biosynthesis